MASSNVVRVEYLKYFQTDESRFQSLNRANSLIEAGKKVSAVLIVDADTGETIVVDDVTWAEKGTDMNEERINVYSSDGTRYIAWGWQLKKKYILGKIHFILDGKEFKIGKDDKKEQTIEEKRTLFGYASTLITKHKVQVRFMEEMNTRVTTAEIVSIDPENLTFTVKTGYKYYCE